MTTAHLKSKPGADYTTASRRISLPPRSTAGRRGILRSSLAICRGQGRRGDSHTLSFDINRTPLPTENSPRRLFERLFVAESAGDRAATMKRYAERRSILDDIAADAQTLDRQLGTGDRRKMDEYLSSVRETEKQVERLQSWIDRPEAEVPETGLQLSASRGTRMTGRCGST